MKHLGDITSLSGASVPIVDCIIGGSPCQDLSIAGKRAGLAGERSGLFMEQIRIVKEMREYDLRMRGSVDDVRPRYMVWENVPGAFTSGNPKGADFQAVLEEIIKVKNKGAANVPIPEGGWSNAGLLMGDGFSIAWRVHDAQFWGVPQRRKRISLVADFNGGGAGQQVPKDTRNCGISLGKEMRESRCSMEFTLDELMASNRRFKLLLGVLNQENHLITETIPNKNRSQYSQEKYQYLLYAPFNVGSQCCNIMKKAPAHKYFRDTGRHPMTAQMAQESRLRTQQWIRNGCNGFNLKIPTSNPMAFWTEQDVLQYIKQNNLPLASVYGDIVYTDDDGYEYDNPMFNDGMKLKTTGCDRTGCMFCGFGCHLEKDKSRFVMMKQTHPKQYEYIMKSWEDGGLNYKEVIDWLNENGNLNIKY